ncbi:MAG: glycosyltransferase family 39 protein [Anaerolineae bacterium]
MRRNVNHWLWVVPVLLLTAMLTARLLDASAIWVDEYWTYRTGDGAFFGPASPHSIIEGIIVEDPWTVPAYFFMFNMWAGLVGWSPFAIRALSLLAGVLAVAWTYRLGRDVGGHRVGLGAALALGASAFFIHYIGEMRNYAIMPLFGVFAVWAYWRISHSQRPSRLLQAAFVLCVAIMPYLHYFAVLPLAGVAAYHVLTLFNRENTQIRPYMTITWWRPLFLLAYGALLFLPWLLLVTLPVLNRVATEGHQSPHLTWLDAPGTVLAFANGSAVLVLLVGGYLLTYFERKAEARREGTRREGVTFALVSTLVAIVAGFLINQWRPILLYYRYLIAIFPLLALCAGFGMARMIRSGVRPLVVYGAWLVGGLAAVFSPTFMDAYHNPLINAQPWHRIVPAMQRLIQPGDAATFNMPDEVWYVWQQFSADFYLHDVPLHYIVLDSFPNVPDENYLTRVDGFVRESNAPRVWNVYPVTPPPDGLHITERALTDNGYAACDLPAEVAGYRLELYARADLPDAVQFDGVGLRLVAPLPAETSSTLDVTLGISVGADVPPETYSISLQVVDAAGTLVRQTDFGVPYPAFSCRHALISDIPAGDYSLNAVVYAWQTQTRLEGTALATGAAGDSLPLGTFRVGG